MILVQIDAGRVRGGSTKIEPRLSGSLLQPQGSSNRKFLGSRQCAPKAQRIRISRSVGKYFKCIVLRVLYTLRRFIIVVLYLRYILLSMYFTLADDKRFLLLPTSRIANADDIVITPGFVDYFISFFFFEESSVLDFKVHSLNFTSLNLYHEAVLCELRSHSILSNIRRQFPKIPDAPPLTHEAMHTR